MVDRVQTVVVEELEAAERLQKKGALYSAAARLGVLSSASDWFDRRTAGLVEDSVRAFWARVDNEALRVQVVQRVSQLRRLVNYGSRFETEELVLALTLRLELGGILCGLAPISQLLNFELGDCDAALGELANSQSNSVRYHQALRLLERNWMHQIPFRTERLGIPSAVARTLSG